MNTEMTAHALFRMQQRGRRSMELEFVLKHGTTTREGLLLCKKDVARIEREARKQIEMAHRLAGVCLPIAGDAIKTVFKARRRQQRKMLRGFDYATVNGTTGQRI